MNNCENYATANDVRDVSETPKSYGTETKVIQVNNEPSIINAISELWGKFGWIVSNIQVTHSQDTRTYTRDFADYYTGMKTVETTTINYATITLQRNKGIANYERIVKLQNEYENLTASLSLLEDKESLNIPLLVIVFIIFWPAAIYMLYKHNKEEESRKETQRIVRERSGDEIQIHERQRQILEEVSQYIA